MKNSESSQAEIAELQVIGRCVGYSAECLSYAVDRLNPSDFIDPIRRTIWEAILGLHSRKVEISIHSVTDLIHRTMKPDASQIMPVLMDALDIGFSPTNVEYFVSEIIKFSKLRAGRAKLQQIARVNHVTTEALAADAEQVLATVETDDAGRPRTLAQVLSDSFDRLEEMSEGKALVLPTGLRAFDKIAGGFGAGELWIIAARPAVGKTSFALSIADSVAHQEKRTLFFSVEMSELELANRYFAFYSQLSAAKLRAGAVPKTSWPALRKISAHAESVPMEIVEKSSITVGEIAAIAQRSALKGDLGIVIIDYLQLVRGSRNFNSREQEVASISRELKILAKTIKAPIVALSQLNRESEKRADGMPKLSDLRESGALEQDADGVMFIHRPSVHNPNIHPSKTEIIITKNRHGPMGRAEAKFDPETTLFTDVD